MYITRAKMIEVVTEMAKYRPGKYVLLWNMAHEPEDHIYHRRKIEEAARDAITSGAIDPFDFVELMRGEPLDSTWYRNKDWQGIYAGDDPRGDVSDVWELIDYLCEVDFDPETTRPDMFNIIMEEMGIEFR